MFPYLLFVGLVAFSMGYLNSHKIFFAPSFAPVLLNVGFIAGAVFFSSYFKEPLYGLAVGVLVGGFLQVILQIPYLIKEGFRLKIALDLKHPGIQKIFRMMGPALLGIAIYQINILMSTILASFLSSGSISYLYYSDRLTEIVLGIFIISIGNVILPELSTFSASGDFVNIRRIYKSSLSVALFLAIPASIALMVIGLPVISVLFMRGEFTSLNAEMTYKALFYASMGIASISIIRITVPTFYSLKETKIPVIASAISFVLNILFGYFLMQTHLKHAGLTLANSISATIQMIFLLFMLNKMIGNIDKKSIIISILKYLLSALLMGILIWYIAGLVDWIHDPFIYRVTYLFLILVTGILSYFLFCSILRVEETKYLLNILIKRFRRS